MLFYFQNFFEFIIGMIGKNVFEGSQTTLCCAVDPELHLKTGDYFDESHPSWVTAEAASMSQGKQLWKKTEELIKPHWAKLQNK